MSSPTLTKPTTPIEEKAPAPTFPRYQLASRGSFIYPSGKRVDSPDGTIVAENQTEQDYLQLSCEAGCIYIVTPETEDAIRAKELNPQVDHV